MRIEGGDTLTVAPLMPADWDGFSVTYRYRNTYHHIRVRRVGPDTRRTVRVQVDDTDVPDRRLHLVDDGRTRQVLIEVG